ncbi:Uncharacterised protein [Enterobacter hormaechei]|nr:Uncharacterised protein [Enterobacter hormaechei]
MVRIRRHKARQNVRLTEVAQAPAHQGDDGDKVQPFQHIDVFNALLLDHFQRFAKAADGENDNHRSQDQGEDHQARLHGVGPAYRQESAHEGIEDGRGRTGPQGGFIAHAESTFEQTRARHDAGSTVDGEEQQDHHRRDNAQDTAVIFKASGEVVRQRQRVVVGFGMHTQTACYQLPVDPCANGQADGDPAFGDTGDENRARQPHQQPAAHVGSARRECGDHRA